MDAHALRAEEILDKLNTKETGLLSSEASRRLAQYGYNELKEEGRKHPLILFLEQFVSPIIWVLIAATLISIFVREYIDAMVIGIILILNAVLGFIQEYKASKAIEALKKMASPKARVLRDGKAQEIDATVLVPGDIVMVETGGKVPADCRLLGLSNLETQEAALTGESLPVKKNLDVVAKDAPLGDRKNLLFSGTIITKGRGTAVVAETGMKTEIGRIATMIQTAEEALTPLQKQLGHLGKWLGILVVVICAVVFASGVLRGGDLMEMFIAAVALAVAAIPEGLPAVVTIGLALGVQRMVRRNALIRKLPSVETLGCTTVICTDKTGTLTKNEMTVRKIFVDGEVVDVTGSGYEVRGDFSKKTSGLELLLRIGALNNDAKLDYEKAEIIGDPTEACLVVVAAKEGMRKEALEEQYTRIDEIPFDSERKRMTTIHQHGESRLAYMKGAPDEVLKLCTHIVVGGSVQPLTEDWKEKILKNNEVFAESALRVLGFAYKELKEEKLSEEIEREMVFVGLQGMIDPPREEVKEAIAKCKEAGVKVIVVTGDFIGTAKAIGDELGIKGRAITGSELDAIEDLKREIDGIGICARVNPEHKVKILEALQAEDYVVAMTGDGVNDAPALKRADIGIAMGITGTDVAKEASKMILTDDNFASIVNAVEEGRTIYDNIRKFVEYLLSSNVGEVLTVFIAILIGLPLPLIAIHLLWINLITDGLPALSLGVEPAEAGIMQRAPRRPEERILNIHRGFYLFGVGLIMMVGTLAVFHFCNPSGNLMYARSMAFTTLVIYQMFNVLNCRGLDKSLFKLGWFSNWKLWGAIVISVLLQLIVLYGPMNTYFKTMPLGGMDWLVVVVVSSSVLVFGEVVKLLRGCSFLSNRS